MLHPKKNIDIEVMEDNLMTYRVFVHNMDSPAKFTITYKKDKNQDKARLRLFVSFEEKEPRAGKCDEVFYTPS